jgi:hypothetical protein
VFLISVQNHENSWQGFKLVRCNIESLHKSRHFQNKFETRNISVISWEPKNFVVNVSVYFFSKLINKLVPHFFCNISGKHGCNLITAIDIRDGNGFSRGNQNYLCFMSCYRHAISSEEGQLWGNHAFHSTPTIATRRPPGVSTSSSSTILGIHLVLRFILFLFFPFIRFYTPSPKAGILKFYHWIVTFYLSDLLSLFYWIDRKFSLVHWRFSSSKFSQIWDLTFYRSPSVLLQNMMEIQYRNIKTVDVSGPYIFMTCLGTKTTLHYLADLLK